MYDPSLGRFLQTDPVGNQDDVNLYAYVYNDPLNRADPSGLRCTGTGEESQCTLDTYDGKHVSQSTREQNPQIGKLEAKLTEGYKDLQTAAANHQVIRIEGNEKLGIKPLDIKAETLLSRVKNADLNGVSRDFTRVDPKTGQAYSPRAESYRDSVTFYRKAFQNVDQMPRVFKHEVLHMESRTQPWDQYIFEHQEPFNAAADSIGN